MTLAREIAHSLVLFALIGSVVGAGLLFGWVLG